MGKIKILIVEDETVIAMDMADHLEDIGYEVVDTVIDYSGAIEALENEVVDIALIDIMLGGSKDGIELAKTIRERFDLPFIFLTSHSDKATVEAATAARPNGYLIKPFEVDHIYAAIEAAISNYSGNDKQDIKSEVLVRDSLFIKSDRLFVKVKISEILWLQSDGNYIKVVANEHKHMVRSSFSNFLEKLPAKSFVKVHKSYYVNIDQVDGVNHTFVLIKGHEIPLSRNYRDQLYNGLNRVL